MNRVFISYSHKDEDWVKNWLLQKLEEEGIDTYIDYRDFEIGVPSLINMERAVEQCAKTLLVFTPHWVNSEWTQFEGLILQTQDPIGLRKKILPLMRCDCQLPPRLKMFTYADFRDPNDWDFQLNRLITQIKKDFAELAPRTAYPPLSEEYIDLSRLPKTEFELFGRSHELNLLDQAWESAAINIVSFVAYGGVGKTTLVNKWVEKLRWDNFRGAERVFAWSFYSQGTNELVTSADAFINAALLWFGEPQPERYRSPWDKGKRLAELVRQNKTLLILDGLEPLQSGFDFEKGKIKDPGLSTLVAELARRNNGLCVITTREPVPEIERCAGSCRQINLEQISEEAGAALLKIRRVNGSDDELQRLSREFGKHALAINLLAEYLRLFPGHGARHGFEVPDLNIPVEKGRHARRVMEALAKHFGEGAELELLLLLGLFSRPAPQAALDDLMKPPVISSLTDHLSRCRESDWLRLLQKLRDFKLIARESKHRPDVIDCHPLIREHFGHKLRKKAPEGWRMAHERLYEYYKNLPQKLYGKELPDTLEEMEPLFAAVAHGCQAGKHQEVVVNVYWERIRRTGEDYAFKKLGAFGSVLAALSNFFDSPWEKIIPKLEDMWKAGIFNWAGFGLRALGRLREAAQPMQAGLEMQAKNKDWENAASAAGNLSELYLTLGEVTEAVRYARQSVDFADRSEDGFQKYSKRTTLADALHQAGELAQAEEWFRKAEAMQGKRQPEYRYLYSVQGFQFCDLLLAQGQVQEVLERAKQTLECEKEGWYSLLSIALDKLSLGRAYVLAAVGKRKMDSTSEVESIFLMFQTAADYLNQAVAGLREAGHHEFIARGLFARAFYYRLQQQFSQAWEDLDEAREIAERGDMRLWLVDYHLEAGRVISDQLAVGSLQSPVGSSQSAVGGFEVLVNGKIVVLGRNDMVEQLKLHVEQADHLVEKTGYRRRSPEVELGYAALFLAQGDLVRAREHLGRGKRLLEEMGIREWDFWVLELSRLSG
jgi:tetratricopeptide (TPR) repeat protein